MNSKGVSLKAARRREAIFEPREPRRLLRNQAAGTHSIGSRPRSLVLDTRPTAMRTVLNAADAILRRHSFEAGGATGSQSERLTGHLSFMLREIVDVLQ